MIPITYLVGDATAPISDGPKIIVHCCNNVGAWGAGFVLAVSKRWSEPEEVYRDVADRFRDNIPLGRVDFVHVGPGLTVANIIGQDGVGWDAGMPPIRYHAIAKALIDVCREAKWHGASVHMPRIGCGLAGGTWDQVSRFVEMALCVFDVPVFVYDLAPVPQEVAP